MKLLLISTKSTSPTGGIAVWTDHFLTYCQQHGIESHLVNTEIIGKRSMTHRRSLWDECVRTYRIVSALRQQLNDHTFDGVYLNTSCGTFGLFRDVWLGRIVCQKSVPLITHYHCDIPFWVRRKASIRALGKLAQMSRHNLVLCQNSQRFLLNHYNIMAHKVPNFVHASLIRTMPKAIDGAVKHVVFVGNLTENKGAEELYQIAKQLPHIQFTFIGHVGTSITAWKKPENVTLTGAISKSKVISYLDEADVFLFPSHTEGCSMALMEAMARGLPAIATDTGANAEMLNGGCGFVVPLHDTEAMIAAIRQLDTPSLRREMGSNAINRIKEQYTAHNVELLLSYI